MRVVRTECFVRSPAFVSLLEQLVSAAYLTVSDMANPLPPTPPMPFPGAPFPLPFHRTWWWVCSCPLIHCVEVSLQVQTTVAEGTAGVMSIRDGQDDQVNQCLCIHFFAFGPSKKKIEEALQQSQIGRNRWYSFVPTWAYRGTPSQLQLQKGGTLSFFRGQSSVPCFKVLVSNFTEWPTMPHWKQNLQWQQQASLTRHRLSQAPASDRGTSQDVFLPPMFFATLVPKDDDQWTRGIFLDTFGQVLTCGPCSHQYQPSNRRRMTTLPEVFGLRF